MAKKKTQVRMVSYGRYSQWDKNDKNLPKLKQVTDTIPAVEGEEFGFILEFKKGKGRTIDYRIKHPPIKDQHGNLMPDFTGEYFIRANNYHFFIGDAIWEPVKEKTGIWHITVWMDNVVIGEKTFKVVDEKK
jgi:hypothetical protein